VSVRGKVPLGDQRANDAPDVPTAERGIACNSLDAGKGLVTVISPMPENDDQHEHLSGTEALGTLGFLKRVNLKQQVGDGGKTKPHRLCPPTLVHRRHRVLP